MKLRHYPSVLLAAPIHDSKKYIADEYFKNVIKLEYPKLDMLFIDNSKERAFSEMIEKKYRVEVRHDSRPGTSRERQCNSFNLIRNYFLRNDYYDYLFLLESDLIPNSDIIEHLLSHNKDSVVAVYLLDKQKGISCITMKTYIAIKGGFSNVFVKPGWIDGELKEIIDGCGLGCVLIKRKVIEKIKFRSDKLHADTYFWQDVRTYGFKAFVDTSIIVRHYPSKLKRSDF